MADLLLRAQALRNRIGGIENLSAKGRELADAIHDLAELFIELIPADPDPPRAEPAKAHPLQVAGKKKKRNRAGGDQSQSDQLVAAQRKLRSMAIEFVCRDKTGNHLMIYRGMFRFDFWPSTGRWGRGIGDHPPKETKCAGLGALIDAVLKVPSLLPVRDIGREYPAYLYSDGSVIYMAPGSVRWLAKWSDGSFIKGEDQTGREIDWYFETAEQAAIALLEGHEGPGAK